MCMHARNFKKVLISLSFSCGKISLQHHAMAEALLQRLTTCWPKKGWTYSQMGKQHVYCPI